MLEPLQEPAMEGAERGSTPRLGAAGRPVRVALVGAGYVARFHLEILASLPGVEVVAGVDVDRTRAQGVARRFGAVATTTAIEELPGLGVDVAHVLTPPDLHVPVTRRLLELGIGALVEKPVALDPEAARELGRLAAARGLPLGVNHNNLYQPAFARLLAEVRAGRVGRVEHVRVCLAVPLAQFKAGDFSHWMFRAPENIVFEQATHPFSQLHALVGPVREATTTFLGTRELSPGQVFHDRWLIAAKAERGTAEVYLAFGQSFERTTLEVLGSDGAIEADLSHGLVSWEEKTAWLDFWNSFLAGWRRGGALRRGAVDRLSRYARFTLGLSGRDDLYFAGMRESVTAFYAALAAGAPPPVDAEQAAQVLDWCEVAASEARRQHLRQGPTAVPAPTPAPGSARPGEVVVLGGSGFIGRRVVTALLARGLPVTAVVRRTHALPNELAQPAAKGHLRLLPGRLEDRAALAAAFAGAKTVVHLATGNGETWEEVERAMVRGSVAAAEAALDARVERFIYVSSIAALYAGADCGVAVIGDGMATDPQPEVRDLYSQGKIAAEKALFALYRERGLPLVVVRPGVVLGPGGPLEHGGLGYWARDNHCIGWGRGDHPLPVVTADDVADALARTVTYAGTALDGKALNLCTRTPLSAREIVAELARSTGRSLHFHPRPLWLSQTLEIGKWLVKVTGRRPGVRFPSYRDLKSRALVPPFSAETAREVLGWQPVEERETFLDRAVRAQDRDDRSQ
ncbi:MAG TPA: NAD-dependent epimerase/dehydratase family protein [Thermoanaerobaculia bacterium]|nr:NAD-dependent epimerase/dehydratase family protein [Thermoanaerobaculia bacterium]